MKNWVVYLYLWGYSHQLLYLGVSLGVSLKKLWSFSLLPLVLLKKWALRPRSLRRATRFLLRSHHTWGNILTIWTIPLLRREVPVLTPVAISTLHVTHGLSRSVVTILHITRVPYNCGLNHGCHLTVHTFILADGTAIKTGSLLLWFIDISPRNPGPDRSYAPLISKDASDPAIFLDMPDWESHALETEGLLHLHADNQEQMITYVVVVELIHGYNELPEELQLPLQIFLRASEHLWVPRERRRHCWAYHVPFILIVSSTRSISCLRTEQFSTIWQVI